MNSNRISVLDKLVALADWAKMKQQFTAKDAAIAHDMSIRTIYRYLEALLAIDYRLQGERGVGYLYRYPSSRGCVGGDDGSATGAVLGTPVAVSMHDVNKNAQERQR